jgi:hypothetical protein
MSEQRELPRLDSKQLPGLVAETQVLISTTNDLPQLNDYLTRVLPYLEWLDTFLSNRKLHHRKYQLKRKIFSDLAKQQLSPDEVEATLQHVNREFASRVSNDDGEEQL